MEGKRGKRTTRPCDRSRCCVSLLINSVQKQQTVLPRKLAEWKNRERIGLCKFVDSFISCEAVYQSKEK